MLAETIGEESSLSLMWKWVTLSLHLTLGLLALRFIVKYRRKIYYSVVCLPRDFSAAYSFIRVNIDLLYCQLFDLSVADLLDKLAKKDPRKVIIYFDDEEWTVREVQQLSLKVANYFLKRGVRRGDVIGLLMENSPEFISIWTGLSRIGCLTALLNTNLKGKALSHSLKTVNCKGLIYSQELSTVVNDLEDRGNLELFHCGNDEGTDDQSSSSIDLMDALRGIVPRGMKNQLGFKDILLYMYTSGTTGLPKAVPMKNSRMFMASFALFHFGRLSSSSDRIYTTLPMYHFSGAAVSSCLTTAYGVPVIMRRKFSAAKFWDDCVKYNATVGHYIGELCRYVLAQPENPQEKRHNVRLMLGNGVRPDVWRAFQERFRIKKFVEVYGSTEGNSNLVNCCGKIGAVGFLPHYLQWVVPLKVVRIEEATGRVLRDEEGRVFECDEGEAGELVAKVYRNHPIKDFEGYADKAASESKVLRDAFAKGDVWFRSGDLFAKDECGFFYFLDRIGETFRWKGENCSTTEVESLLSPLCGLQAMVVFGVEVPGAEGKAGMAVIFDTQGILDLPLFAEQMNKVLPKYAQPLFLRVAYCPQMTGTFKLKKMEYEKVGYNINLTDDKIYFLQGGQYVPLDQNLYEDIRQAKLRL